MANWLDKFHNAYSKSSGLLYEIESLADGFARVGNETVANELFAYVAYLRDCNTRMSEAIGDSLREQIATSHSHFISAYRAALEISESD